MSRKLLVVGVLALGFAMARPAMATTDLYPPYGSQPVSAMIGSYTGRNSQGVSITYQVVLWQNKSSGACQFTVIGNGSGLNDNYIVHGTSGADRLYIQGGTNWFCATYYTIRPLVYGGYYLDVTGAAGNDIVENGGPGDSFVYGGDGDDGVSSWSAYGVIAGEDGNDSLYSENLNQVVVGGAGNDCLYSASGSAQTFDCQDGSDSWAGTQVPGAVSCEYHNPYDCPIDWVQ
jgi:Ca2+-binding RTX toxin-like protein